ncbi:hypothetical protein [Mangrovibacterium marinum]|uniref:DUF7670 domain-containing protein n=1 Tax=Mangrovibacterium marinum TaxID=1639118 RepID=UPI000D2FB537|nr:hypothetical protein [Mangrovibacterium marinum]
MKSKSLQILYWLPRVAGIAAILFVSLFALDAFDPALSLWQQWLAFMVHLTPTYVWVALLVLAWKRELVGGVLFVVVGLAFSPVIFLYQYQLNHSLWISLRFVATLSLPFVVVGGFFLWHHFKKKFSKKKYQAQ